MKSLPSFCFAWKRSSQHLLSSLRSEEAQPRALLGKRAASRSPCRWRSWHACSEVTLCFRGHPPCHLHTKRLSTKGHVQPVGRCAHHLCVPSPQSPRELGPTCSCSSPAPPSTPGRQHHGRRVLTCAAGEAVVPASSWPARYPRELAPLLLGAPSPSHCPG